MEIDIGECTLAARRKKLFRANLEFTIIYYLNLRKFYKFPSPASNDIVGAVGSLWVLKLFIYFCRASKSMFSDVSSA